MILIPHFQYNVVMKPHLIDRQYKTPLGPPAIAQLKPNKQNTPGSSRDTSANYLIRHE